MTQQMSNLHINSAQSQAPSSQQQQTLGSWPPHPNTSVSQTICLMSGSSLTGYVRLILGNGIMYPLYGLSQRKKYK